VRRTGGEVIGKLRVRAASPRAAARRVERELWGEIGPALGARAPAEAAAEVARPVAPAPARRAARRRPRVAAAEPREDRTAAEPSEDRTAAELGVAAPGLSDRPGPPWLSVAIGPELYGRHFSYRDDVFEALNEYDLAGTPAVTATGEVYPMAGRARGAVAGLGAAGRFTHVPSFDSEDLAGVQYSSEARSYELGARYRHRIARVDLAGAIDYGGQSFSIAPAGDAADADFPAVRYHYVRAGAAAAAPIASRFAIAGAAGYRQVLSSGQIESPAFFPRSSARGLDLGLELSAALLWGLDVRAGAAVERYGHALEPEPGDPRVAGGALDQYLRFYLRLGFTR
jgi:hypothetical protein